MGLEMSQESMSRLSAFIATATGLHFSKERWPDLLRSINEAASDLGFDGDTGRCALWLAGSPLLSKVQFESLVAHLTVGETYFFRERRHFDFLAEQILPQIIHRGERRMSIWCAGCCTGEEAYSTAITVRRMIPDLENWQVTILATDINQRFLNKAEDGLYGQWSFRDSPDWLKPQYFRARPDNRFEVLPEIRQMVRFATLNLAEDAYPSHLNHTLAMDVIFCRNVLMYFSQPRALQVLEKFYRAQREGGWLFVSSNELSHLSGSSYATIRTPDMAVLRKNAGAPFPLQKLDDVPSASVFPAVVPVPAAPSPADPAPAIIQSSLDPDKEAAVLYAEGRYGEAAVVLRTWLSSVVPDRAHAAGLTLLARCLANQGRLAEALDCCDQSIATDSCAPAGQYLRALILQEQGAVDEAVRALRNCLFLDPRFVMAHVTRGAIARDCGQAAIARRYMKFALDGLEGLGPEVIVPESDGVTVSQLRNMIQSLLHEEAIP